MSGPGEARARAIRGRLTDWLRREAYPLWWAFGVDHGGGGFHERLGERCDIRPEPRRVRVIARQIYVFSVAGRLGFTGRWRSAAGQGLDYFLSRAVLSDGTVRRVIEADGSPRDDSFELYDQAFALFALASAAPVVADRERTETAAVALRDALIARYRHPSHGFEETLPPTVPLKANPHMHLLEAFLAWEAAGGDGVWTALADEIAELGLVRFIDPATGLLREFFAADWSPAPGDAGRIVEPGHLFEWAWLLARWGQSRNRADAVAAAVRLAGEGECIGVDPARGVAINEILDDGSVRDGGARLWPQTERIKGHVAVAGLVESEEARDRHLGLAADAGEALARYFEVDTPGLWRDRMAADGSYRSEPSPASSFYHIVCAIDELDRALPGV